jgi:hypothetical protein
MKEQNGGELCYPYFIVPADSSSYLAGKRQRFPSIEPIHFEKDDVSILSSKELLEASKEIIEDDALPDGLVML